MKAIYIPTGETVELIKELDGDVLVKFPDGHYQNLSDNEPRLIQSHIDWEQRRFELVKEICASRNLNHGLIPDMIKFADAIIEQLKNTSQCSE